MISLEIKLSMTKNTNILEYILAIRGNYLFSSRCHASALTFSTFTSPLNERLLAHHLLLLMCSFVEVTVFVHDG